MPNYAWFAQKVAPYGVTIHNYLDYDDWRDGRAFCALLASTGIYSYSLFADLEDKHRHGFAYRFFEDELGVPQLFSYAQWQNGTHPDDSLFDTYMTALTTALTNWYETHSSVSFIKSFYAFTIQIHFQISILLANPLANLLANPLANPLY